jgi:hypothetical protein
MEQFDPRRGERVVCGRWHESLSGLARLRNLFAIGASRKIDDGGGSAIATSGIFDKRACHLTRHGMLALSVLQLLPDGQIRFSCQDTSEKIFLFSTDPNHR